MIKNKVLKERSYARFIISTIISIVVITGHFSEGAFYIGSPIFRVGHQCSNKKTTCKTGSTAYMEGGYTLIGGTPPVNIKTKFTGIAK